MTDCLFHESYQEIAQGKMHRSDLKLVEKDAISHVTATNTIKITSLKFMIPFLSCCSGVLLPTGKFPHEVCKNYSPHLSGGEENYLQFWVCSSKLKNSHPNICQLDYVQDSPSHVEPTRLLCLSNQMHHGA